MVYAATTLVTRHVFHLKHPVSNTHLMVQQWNPVGCCAMVGWGSTHNLLWAVVRHISSPSHGLLPRRCSRFIMSHVKAHRALASLTMSWRHAVIQTRGGVQPASERPLSCSHPRALGSGGCKIAWWWGREIPQKAHTVLEQSYSEWRAGVPWGSSQRRVAGRREYRLLVQALSSAAGRACADGLLYFS